MGDIPEQPFRDPVLAPIHLAPLLEIYCSPATKNCPHLAALESRSDTLRELRDLGLIEIRDHAVEHWCHGLEVTEKGRVYIEALLRLPLPVQKWVC
jgi:hypothetical protein